MGTRHLIEVIQNGEIKVAQYGQWDGGPMTCKNVTMRDLFDAYIQSHYLGDNTVLVIAVDNVEFDSEREQLQEALCEYGVKTSAQNGFLMVALDTQVAAELMNRFANSSIRMLLYRDGKFIAENGGTL